MGWNFADVWEVVAERLPDAPAQVQGERVVTWREFDRRADGVAQTLLEAGLSAQDKVAQYLYNGPEYLESLFAAFKAGLVPVNTNYRYGDDELVYLWDNADAAAVVFHGAFAETVEALRGRLPGVRLWLWVDDGSGPCPPWASSYESAAARATGRTVAPWGRSPDDLYLLYTGGTTGRPKGVMWRQHDLFSVLNASAAITYEGDGDLDAVRTALHEPGPTHLPAPPLMHGTAAFSSFLAMNVGGGIVTLAQRSFDVVELLDTVDRRRVNTMAIVGDAFAKPMLRHLDEQPGRWDVSSLVFILSSGVMWSEDTKQGLLRHHPGMLLVDQFSSSEALGMGSSISTADGASGTARFQLGSNARVIDHRGRDVEPGSDQVGRVAVSGLQPVGYYKDPGKTAETFIELDGQRYSIPGDYAMVEADGTLTLLGRGSMCINTGGEKVYPEEVEEALKTHASILDAVAVGVPDERFGEAVTAVVELREEADGLDEHDVIAHVKQRLASYKAPRRLIAVQSIARSPNGKVDYRRLRELAIAEVPS
jgi:3-oxocholest-4-en-26-oate---CoA ligase